MLLACLQRILLNSLRTTAKQFFKLLFYELCAERAKEMDETIE